MTPTTATTRTVVAAIESRRRWPPDVPPRRSRTRCRRPRPTAWPRCRRAPPPSRPALPPPVQCGDPTASLRPFPAGQIPDSASLDAIRQRGRLVVGLDTGSNLLSFRNPTTDEIEGFDVDIAREIARDLLGSPDKVEFRVLNYAEREQALEDGRVDIVAKTMAITCERRQRIDFSTVYYDAHQRILVMAGSPVRDVSDLAGRRVCVGEGTTSLERVERQQPDAAVVTVPMWSDCLVMLQQNQVDAISTDDTLLLGWPRRIPTRASSARTWATSATASGWRKATRTWSGS